MDQILLLEIEIMVCFYLDFIDLLVGLLHDEIHHLLNLLVVTILSRHLASTLTSRSVRWGPGSKSKVSSKIDLKGNAT